MKQIPSLHKSDRVMVLAPHPDDETLAAGIALQQAKAAGAAVRVVFATAGEANPWPQRWIERRWYLDAEDRRRWGARRSEEARAALSRLGLAADAAVFLGWPDGQVLQLLIDDGDRAIAQLAALFAEFRPTRVVLPSIRDQHPDHSALNLIARAALLGLGDRCDPLLLEFLLHAGRSERAAMDWHQAASDDVLPAAKMVALEAHQTQLRLNRGWLRGRASAPEAFALATRQTADSLPQAAAIARLPDVSGRSRLQLDARHPAARRSRLGLLLAGVSPGRVQLWRCVSGHGSKDAGSNDSGAENRDSGTVLTDCASGALLGSVDYQQEGSCVLLTLPCELPGQLLFARFARPRRRLKVIDRDTWEML